MVGVGSLSEQRGGALSGLGKDRVQQALRHPVTQSHPRDFASPATTEIFFPLNSQLKQYIPTQS